MGVWTQIVKSNSALRKKTLEKNLLLDGFIDYGHVLLLSTRSMKYKKRFIRNGKWTSPIFVSCKEQTRPFFSNN